MRFLSVTLSVLVWSLTGCSRNNTGASAIVGTNAVHPPIGNVSPSATVSTPDGGRGWSMDWWNSDSDPYAPSKSFTGIAGIVFVSSEVNADGPTFADNYVVVVHSSITNKLIARGHSNAKGEFWIRLRPGKYIVRTIWWDKKWGAQYSPKTPATVKKGMLRKMMVRY